MWSARKKWILNDYTLSSIYWCYFCIYFQIIVSDFIWACFIVGYTFSSFFIIKLHDCIKFLSHFLKNYKYIYSEACPNRTPTGHCVLFGFHRCSVCRSIWIIYIGLIYRIILIIKIQTENCEYIDSMLCTSLLGSLP